MKTFRIWVTADHSIEVKAERVQEAPDPSEHGVSFGYGAVRFFNGEDVVAGFRLTGILGWTDVG